MISGRMCIASNNVNTEALRAQLDQLHSEAHSTRTKANNARFRLLRLSEAAENLCRQAAKSVRMGKENDARELLVQKKKIMVALEKSKGRVELLDELAAKLNEAITMKEAQLVENVASDFEINGNDADHPVHIVSPPPVSVNNNDPNESNYSNVDEDHEPNPDEDLRIPERFNSMYKAISARKFTGLPLYIDFIKDLDQQLSDIEKDLTAISGLSTFELANGEESNSSEVRKVSEILEHIRDTRVRIHNFLEKNLEASYTCLFP